MLVDIIYTFQHYILPFRPKILGFKKVFLNLTDISTYDIFIISTSASLFGR